MQKFCWEENNYPYKPLCSDAIGIIWGGWDPGIYTSVKYGKLWKKSSGVNDKIGFISPTEIVGENFMDTYRFYFGKGLNFDFLNYETQINQRKINCQNKAK